MIVRTNYKVQESEIGIAVSHYHAKLGPMFLATQFNFDLFDRISQYNILQDSISSRSENLSLLISSKEGIAYTIRIKKVKVEDVSARGGVKRYALLLFIPSNIKKLEIGIEDISEDIAEKLSQGTYINQALKAWGTLINDIHGPVNFERDISESEKIPDQLIN